MAYNTEIPPPPRSFVPGFTAGAEISRRAREDREQREMAERRLKLEVDERKQMALDRAVAEQGTKRLAELAATFPTAPTPQSYDEAVKGMGGDAALQLPSQQYKWIGENAPAMLQLPGGMQLLQRFQQLADSTRLIQGSSIAKELKDRSDARNARVFEKYNEVNPTTIKAYNQGETLKFIQEDLRRNNLPLEQVPPDVLDELGNLNDLGYYNWKMRLQAHHPVEQGVSFIEDPATGQRYAIRGRSMIKSGISTEAEEAKVKLDAQLDAIQGQMRALAADPLFRFNTDERNKRMKELEQRQQQLIKDHYDAFRNRKINPNEPSPVDGEQFQSTDSPPVVIRVTPDGRRVIYDSVTKKPLRYAD